MKLYVCFGTFGAKSGHPCATAHQALLDAGHKPEVVKAPGSRLLPDALNVAPGRKRAKALTGSTTVPVLELDDGTAVAESGPIIAWAKANPA